MAQRRFSVWDLVFVVFELVAAAGAAYLFLKDQVGVGLMAIVAFIVGLAALGFGLFRDSVPMPVPVATHQPRVLPEWKRRDLPRDGSGRRLNWLWTSAISGLCATTVMSVILFCAYGVLVGIGSTAPGASQFEQWCAGLVNNTLVRSAQTNLVVALILDFCAGIAWAILYGAIFEPRLPGRGLVKGLIFAIIPWIFSLLVFFPIAGVGIFGLGLSAGPLPIVGNLILHAIYGLTLGGIMETEGILADDGERIDTEEPHRLARMERGMAIAIIPGLIIGGLIGGFGAASIAPGMSSAAVTATGAIIGCATGVLLGSFAGVTSKA